MLLQTEQATIPYFSGLRFFFPISLSLSFLDSPFFISFLSHPNYGFGIIVATESKAAFRFPPKSVTAPTITAAINATRIAYSTALAPPSSLKSFNSFSNDFNFPLVPDLEKLAFGRKFLYVLSAILSHSPHQLLTLLHRLWGILAIQILLTPLKTGNELNGQSFLHDR
jgi:hypothetical protein